MLVSKFKGIAYSPIFLSPLVLILVIVSYYFSDDGITSTMFLFCCALLVLWMVLIYYMLNTYFVSVKIHHNEISVKSILGKGKPQNFAMNSLDGFQLQQQSGETNSSEVIFIYQKGKVVVRLSELFYQNYPELKKAISQKLKKIQST